MWGCITEPVIVLRVCIQLLSDHFLLYISPSYMHFTVTLYSCSVLHYIQCHGKISYEGAALSLAFDSFLSAISTTELDDYVHALQIIVSYPGPRDYPNQLTSNMVT